MTIVGTLAIVAAFIALGTWLTRKKSFLVKPAELAALEPAAKRPSYSAGEAPATAIRASGDQLARLRTTQRCRECRAVMTAVSEEHVRYGGGELLVIELSCGSCKARRALYVSEARPTTA